MRIGVLLCCGVIAVARGNFAPAVNDFDFDGRTDAGWYDAKTGTWTIRFSGGGIWDSNAVQRFSFGYAGTVTLPGDFDGTGTADFCLYDPATSRWHLRPDSAPGTNFVLGTPGDLPVTGDFDGDQRTDCGVCDPSRGQWTIRLATGGVRTVSVGGAGYVPVAADFDGDGRDDPAAYRATDGNWKLLCSTAGLQQTFFGFPGTYPAAADFDGDGRADFAIVNQPIESGGTGRPHPYLLQTTRGATNRTLWGMAYRAGRFGVGDYDADGRMDFLSDEQRDYGIFSRIENLNDAVPVDLPLVTNRYPGVPLTGIAPTLDGRLGWHTPAELVQSVPLAPYSATLKLASGKSLKLNCGNGTVPDISVRDASGATAAATIGWLGETPFYHLGSAGTTATGPFTFLGRRTAFRTVPIVFAGSYSYIAVLVEQIDGTFRDATGTQTATVTRYQFAAVLGGAL